MMTRTDNKQITFHLVTIEDLVPENHFLRKLNRLVDFSFIYDETAQLYCQNNGRPCVDPVVLVKYLLIGFLFGIESERRMEQEIQVNMAYRWFLGLDMDERVPDHSTISQNRRRRFNGTGLFRRLFEGIVFQCIEKGLVDGRTILTDSTHVKVNASPKKNIKIFVQKETSNYMKRLDFYEEKERQRLEQSGAIRPKRKSRGQKKKPFIEKSISPADPEAGMLKRPGKPAGPHYLSHQSIDAAHGIIVDVAVTPGNVNDSGPYLERVEYMRNHLGLGIETAGADSAYGTSLICKVLDDMGIRLYTPGTTGGVNYKTEFTRKDFKYQKEADCFICPCGKRLTLRSLEREEFNICRVYRAERGDCRGCCMFRQCVSGSQKSRTVRVNIFEEAAARCHPKRKTTHHTQILRLRQIWCEGRFAAQKARHNLRGLYRRGLEAAESHCLLSAMSINLKRIVTCLE